LIAAGVHTDGSEFTAGTPKAVFPLKAPLAFSPNVWRPMRDGQRFLVLRPAEAASAAARHPPHQHAG